MSLVLRITHAGRAALVNAARDGTNAVRIASVGVSPTANGPDPALTFLPGERKRIATISGGATAADVIHLTVRDESADSYTVRSFALYLADGTLFALYGQADPIIEKSAAALLLLAIDATLVDVAASQVTFGNANFLNPAATTETQGVVELATEAEAAAMADALRALTPKGMAAIFTAANILQRLLQADGSGSGLDADLLDGREGSYYTDIVGRLGYTPVSRAGDTMHGRLNFSDAQGFWSTGLRANANEYTIREEQWGTEVLVVDSKGSLKIGAPGQDGDRVFSASNISTFFNIIASGTPGGGTRFLTSWVSGGQGPLIFENGVGEYARFSPAGVLQLKLVATRAGNTIWDAGNDGAGSGLDADLLDGQHGSYYTDILGRLGYTPLNRAGDTMTGRLRFADAQGVWSAGLRENLNEFTIREEQWGTEVLVLDRRGSLKIGSSEQLGDRVFSLLNASTSFNVIASGTPGGGTRFLSSWVSGGQGPLIFENSGGEYARFTAAGILQLALAATRAGSTIWDAGNDGAGSGMDADLLDGQHGSWYADIVARLGYKPVQQGGGVGQIANAVRIGWSGTRLKATVDASDLGAVVFDSNIADVWRTSNDGAGSGLDADLLDGLHASSFIRRNTGARPIDFDSETGALTVTGGQNGWAIGLYLKGSAGADLGGFGALGAGNGLSYYFVGPAYNAVNSLKVYPDRVTWSDGAVWHAGNDGAGSGLDADLLDGRHAAAFALLTGAAFTGRVSAPTASFQSADMGSNAGNYTIIVPDGVDQWRVRDNQFGTNCLVVGRGGSSVPGTFEAGGGFTRAGSKVWDAGNDGAGSGLDADLLDGWHRDDVRDWNNLLNKPGSFPPSAHTHGAADIAPAFATRSFAADGYQVLPGGLILQWVTGATDQAGGELTQTITYPIAFPNRVLRAFPSTQIANSSNRADALYQLVGEPGAASAIVQRQRVDTSNDFTNTTPHLFVIGY